MNQSSYKEHKRRHLFQFKLDLPYMRVNDYFLRRLIAKLSGENNQKTKLTELNFFF